MKSVKWLLYLYVFLKPFYLFGSGGLQISDLFLLIAFGIVFFIRPKNELNGIQKKIINNLKYFVIFVICVCFINFIYFVKYLDFDFIISSLHYVFVLFGIYTFVQVLADNIFWKKIYMILNLNIIIQAIIFLLNLGNYYAEVRYMGTFNDPNQFAFFVFLSLLLMYIINKIIHGKYLKSIIFTNITGIILILLSASTGILLGTLVYLISISYVYFKTKSFPKKVIFTKKNVLFIGIGSICLSLGLLNFSILNNDLNFELEFDSDLLVSRIYSKFDKVSGESDMSILEDRGIDKLFIYPEYMIFGAGQGGYYRYTDAYSQNELHSTLPSILFYYGIIPFLILCYWLYQQIKGAKIDILLIMVGVFIESFLLLNQRQLFLWLLFILLFYEKELGGYSHE